MLVDVAEATCRQPDTCRFREDDLLLSRSAWQLPVLVAQVGEVIDGLGRRHGHLATAAISHQPDPRIERLFGAMPDLATPVAERAGFAPDASVDELVNAVTV